MCRASFAAMGGVFLSEATGEFVAMWASYSFSTTKGNQEVRGKSACPIDWVIVLGGGGGGGEGGPTEGPLSS